VNGKAKRLRATSEMASCMQVMRVLQSYVDGHADEVTARRVTNHLDACRRCGLEVSTYRQIKAAVARHGHPIDETSVARLRAFGAALVSKGDGLGEDDPA
jgi:anti-sigma factor RsiW